jgi:hypothetical protein
MSVISDALKKKGIKPSMEITIGKAAPASEGGMEAAEESSEVDASPEEVTAMEEFQKAESAEEKAMALKAFIKLCG